MAEKDSPGPSLELPSLFDRKKKRRSSTSPADAEPAPDRSPSADTAPAAEAPSQAAATPAPAPAPAPTPAPARVEAEPEPASRPTEAPAARATETGRTTAPATEPVPATEQTRVDSPAVGTPATQARSSEPVPTAAPEAAPAPTRAAAPTTVRTSERPAPAASTAPGTAASDVPHGAGPGADEDGSEGRRRPRTPSLPDLGLSAAALVVGALVGLLGVVLTFLGLKGCELVTGADSCGGPGLLVLIAILVAMVLAGAAMLRLFSVPDAGSVSFLGVGVLTVIVLVLLLDVLTSPVMIVVIPALAAGCYALARWVTTQLGEDVMNDR